MSLNDTASRAMSSSPRTGMRSVRWPSAKRSAIRDADRTGSTIWRATISAMAASMQQQHHAAGDHRAAHQRDGADSSLFSGKIRYSSRLVTGDDVGVPMINAGPEKPSVRTVAYW